MSATPQVDTPPLILASSSVFRAALLEQIGLVFTTASPDIDESARDNEPADALACRLAEAKAAKIARDHADAIVIGSDQVAHLDGRILGKPGTPAKAREQLAF